MLATRLDQNPWRVVDEAPPSARITSIRSMMFDGEAMLADLRLNPTIPLGLGVTIDFNDQEWDLSGITDLPIPPTTLRMTFPRTDLGDIVKLHTLCCLFWRRTKVQTAFNYARTCIIALEAMGVDGGGLRLMTVEDYERRREAISHMSFSHQTTEARRLYRLLRFYDTYFGGVADPELLPFFDRISKEAARKIDFMSGHAAIPDDYLDPLIAVCKRVMHDTASPNRLRVAAAATLLASQVGLRSAELVALEEGALRMSRGFGDQPDLDYVDFKTFKGAKGNRNYKEAHSALNATALEAYLWLEDNCRDARARLGTRSLIATEKQKGRYYSSSSLVDSYHTLLLAHADEIPCINTQDRFPQLTATTGFSRGKSPMIARLIGPDDHFVRPSFHQFRVTVATKLYEAGVDLRYIRKQMSHLSEDVTAGYIRSDEDVSRRASEAVYRAVLIDGARLIGPHGEEFAERVRASIESLGERVKADEDAIVAYAAERYPLRRKLGGICVRCGNIVPCAANSPTDDIYCAFGVCPNQCQTYYLLPETLGMLASHRGLVEENVRRGHTKAARNELRKAQNIIRGALLPELDSLDEELGKFGVEGVCERFPELEETIARRKTIREEAEEWLGMGV